MASKEVSKEGPQGQRPTNKRKAPPGSSADNNAWRNKRQKVQRDARTLAVQTTSKAFKNGELDVGAFVKAREYEIRALEEGLARSKKSLTQRAFQQVPKELRRRTASHNAKRVPKRLRKQAVREMIDDNTPTVTSRRRKPTKHMRLRMETVKRLRALGAKRKTSASAIVENGDAQRQDNKQTTPAGSAKTPIVTRAAKVKKNALRSSPLPPAKFRKRQVHKTWLPTHIYHAKRAHMTPPREPLWRFSVPLTSTAKSYRPTHRASNERGAIAWDMSYMSCVSLEGAEQSIQGVLKALSVGGPGDSAAPWGLKGKKWRSGTRVWQGWLYERDMYPSKPIAPATVIWRPETLRKAPTESARNENLKVPSGKPASRQVLLRVHPSAFLQLWEQIVRLVKVQKPQVVAEDLRFDIGSIEITGPASTEAMLGTLRHIDLDGKTPEGAALKDTLAVLAGITNPAVLPANALLSFDVTDPRLRHPPPTIDTGSQANHTELYRILAQWPCDSASVPSGLFDQKRRLASCRALSSQKAINRRKALAKPGTYLDPLPQDPRIPVLVYPTSDAQHGAKPGKSGHSTWVILMPWKTVLPTWQSLMYYPLSTGGQVRLGGLQEKRQVAFESGSPWFPGDFPGTEAGKAWEALETTRRRKEWERRPKGKRIEWGSVTLAPGRVGEIGDGCSCDWDYLANSAAEAIEEVPTDPQVKPANTGLHQLSSSVVRSQLTGSVPPSINENSGLFTVRLVLLTRGVPASCARIYRLPRPDHSSKDSLRSQWLALDPRRPGQKPRAKEKRMIAYLRGAPQPEVQQKLAADLLRAPAGDRGAGDDENENGHPFVPDTEDLVGFVTAGEFCLTEGNGVAIGSLLLAKVLEGQKPGVAADSRERRLCVVRNAGETIGRLAEWTVV